MTPLITVNGKLATDLHRPSIYVIRSNRNPSILSHKEKLIVLQQPITFNGKTIYLNCVAGYVYIEYIPSPKQQTIKLNVLLGEGISRVVWFVWYLLWLFIIFFFFPFLLTITFVVGNLLLVALCVCIKNGINERKMRSNQMSRWIPAICN